MAMLAVDSWQLRDKIEQVIKLVARKGSYRPNNEFLIDVALAFPHTVNLAYRYFHSLCQVREVLVAIITELKNPCLYYHDTTSRTTIDHIIDHSMSFVK